MNTRYTVLPVVAMLLKLLSYVVFVVGMVLVLKYLFLGIAEGADFWLGHVVPAGKELVSTLVRGLLLFATSELIHVVMDIEENTRRTSEAATGGGVVATPRK
jgi:hypothetical protein